MSHEETANVTRVQRQVRPAQGRRDLASFHTLWPPPLFTDKGDCEDNSHSPGKHAPVPSRARPGHREVLPNRLGVQLVAGQHHLLTPASVG